MQTKQLFLSRISVFLVTLLLPLLLSAQLSKEQQQIDNYLNPQASMFISKGKTLEDYKNRSQKVNGDFVEMKSIAEHPVLSKKMKKGAKAFDNIGIENLEKRGEFTTPTWGIATLLEDGSAIYFTQEFEISFVYGISQAYYKSTTINLLDKNFEIIKSIKIKTPDTTQSISVLPIFSKKSFNTDDKLEFAVQVHGFASEFWGQGPISCRDTILVVNEDGDILRKYGNATGAFIQKIGYNNRIVINHANYSALSDTTELTVYNAKKEQPAIPLHTYKVSNNLLAYCGGPTFDLMKVNGKDCYVSTSYTVPFDSIENPANPILSKNIKFKIEIIDAENFQLVKKIELPIIGKENHEWSMADVSSFSDIMFTTNMFNSDPLMEIIFTVPRYYIDCDCNRNDIYLMNENGEMLELIIEKTGGTQKLQNIIGEPEEYAVFRGGEGKIESVQMFEMPTMKLSANFPAQYLGEQLSLNFERVSTPNGREYVFGLGGAEITKETVYAGIVYFNTKGELTNRVRIDVGNKIAIATPIINAGVLDPYLINTDDKREYLLFGKEYLNAEASTTISYFAISNDEGKILYKWYNHPTYGSFNGAAGIMQNKAQDRVESLYVSFSDKNTGESGTTIYKLPFTTLPMEGKGTRANPFIVTTPAQLDAVRNNDSAYYELGNDIDMSDFVGYLGNGLSPLFSDLNEGFKGTFDGKGFIIKNLFMKNSKYGIGLFSSVNGGIIRNLTVKNFVFKNEVASNIGVICASLTGGSIINCHVEGDLQGKAAITGGLVGLASMDSKIENSTYNGTIELLKGKEIGGIVGRLATGSIVKLSYTQGSITGLNSLGGIAGTILTNAIVESSYSSMNITGGGTQGGIVGNQRGGYVRENYSTGAIYASKDIDKWASFVGGIVGEVSGTSFTSRNFALNSKITGTVEDETARIANGDYIPTVTFDSNYALSTMKIGLLGEEAALGADAPFIGVDQMHGAGKTAIEMNQAFYESQGWKFGTSAASPWKMVNNIPHLWYEFVVRGVELNEQNLTLDINESAKLIATVLPATAENKEVLWISSDASVVSVDQEGNIKAKKKGSARITVITDDGDFEKTCLVKVIQPITSIQLDQTEIFIASEDQFLINATILPADADSKILKWVSVNPLVAKVFGGIVIGKEIGKTLIIASSEDGEVSDTCIVNVIVAVDRIILDKTEAELKIGETVKLSASVRPTSATNKSVSWESADATIATVDNTGLVTAIGAGKVNIVVKSISNPSITASCEVSVEKVGVDGTEDIVFNAYMRGNMLQLESNLMIDQIFIYDLLGHPIYQKEQSGTTLEISMQNTPQGIYLIKAIFRNGQITHFKIKK